MELDDCAWFLHTQDEDWAASEATQSVSFSTPREPNQSVAFRTMTWLSHLDSASIACSGLSPSADDMDWGTSATWLFSSVSLAAGLAEFAER